MILKDVEKIADDFKEIKHDLPTAQIAIDFLGTMLASYPAVDAIPVRDVAWMFTNFTGEEPPCCFNDMDELTDEWCNIYCEDHNPVDCWMHAIKEGWIK